MNLKKRDWLAVLLAVLALAVYLPGSTWGIPKATGVDRTHSWGNDDQVPLAPLAEMHNTFVVAKPDRNVSYPWFLYFLFACSYAPYLLYLFLTGGLANPTGAYPFGLTDPDTAFRYLSYLGRTIPLALAVAVVVGAYYTGKHLWGRTAGVLTGLFAMFLFPLAYYARLGNPDAPVLGWTSLGLAFFALCLRQGLTVKRGMWFGAFIALGAATKDQSAGSFAFLPLVLLWLHLRAGKADRLWRWSGVWCAPAATVASLVSVYVLASGIVVDPARYAQHVSRVLRVSTTRTGAYTRHPATFEGTLAQAGDIFSLLTDVMGWPLLIVAVIGFVMALRRDRRSATLALSSLGFFLMLLPVGLSRIHYLLPVALPLTAFAGYAFSRGIESARWLRIPSVLAALGACGFLALQTFDLTHDMLFDSRYPAGAWLEERTRPGDRVLYFGFGLKLPHLRGDVETVHVFRREDAVSIIEAKQPAYILLIPQDIDEHRERVQWRHGPASVISPIPVEFYHTMTSGPKGYRLVAQFQTPRLFPWLPRPFLSYPTLNPPVHILARVDRVEGNPNLALWNTAPHYPPFVGSREIMTGSVAAGESR